jgi:hypothetical protein
MCSRTGYAELDILLVQDVKRSIGAGPILRPVVTRFDSIEGSIHWPVNTVQRGEIDTGLSLGGETDTGLLLQCQCYWLARPTLGGEIDMTLGGETGLQDTGLPDLTLGGETDTGRRDW